MIGTAPGVAVTLYVVPNACSYGRLADGFAAIASDDATKHYAAVTHSYGATEDDYVYYEGSSERAVEHAVLKASDNAVVAVGGTGALGLSEQSAPARGIGPGDGGGGVSADFTIPAWQKSVPGVAHRSSAPCVLSKRGIALGSLPRQARFESVRTHHTDVV